MFNKCVPRKEISFLINLQVECLNSVNVCYNDIYMTMNIYVTMICYDIIYNMIEGNSFQIYLSSHTHHAHEHLKCDAQKFKQKRR